MQTIIVDTTPGYRMPTVFYSQGDIGTQFAIDLRSRFGDTLPANPTVTIQATKPSGLGYSVAATSFSSGVAIFTMTETMTNEAGRFPAELKVVDGNVTLFTANFYMEGEASAHPEGTTDGDIEHILPQFMSVNVETLAAGTDATYSYDPETNSATFGIPQGANGSLASSVLAPTYSTSATYAVGDYVYYNGNLYRCTTAITTAEAWTSGHWALVAVGPELTDVKSDLKGVRSTLFGDVDKIYEQGAYFENGKVASNARVRTANPIPAGKYYIKVNDSSYYFYTFKYISDSEGVQLYGKRTTDLVVDSQDPLMFTLQAVAGTNINVGMAYPAITITKVHSSLGDKLTDDINALDFALSPSIESLELNAFGVASVRYDVDVDKRFYDSGYATSVGYACIATKFDVGTYDITTTLGADYQYSIWKYNSDSSGEAYQSYGNTSRSGVFFPQKCVICLRKLSGTTFSSAEVKEVRQKLLITKHANAGEILQSNYSYKLQKYSNVLNFSSITLASGFGASNADVTVNGENSFLAYTPTGTLIDLRCSVSSAITLEGISEIDAVVYIPDSSLITTITLQIMGTNYSRSASFVDGWNELRFYTYEGDLSTWATATTIRLVVGGTAGMSLYVGKIATVSPTKARVILVDDGAYKTFYDVAYPSLKADNIPVTWALCPQRMINEDSLIISLSELENISGDACSEFSYHSWASQPTSSMTVPELQQDTAQCLHYLRKNGLLPKHIWRAATTQNTSPNYMALVGFLEAIATGTNATGATTFPFPDRYNIARTLIHGRTESQIDAFFTLMEKTHCTYVFYTHGVDNLAETNITPTLWAYFLDKLEDAIDDGYVECTTFNRLMMEYE